MGIYIFDLIYFYSARFGVNYVDFTHPNRTRTPKVSAFELTKIFRENGFPPETKY